MRDVVMIAIATVVAVLVSLAMSDVSTDQVPDTEDVVNEVIAELEARQPDPIFERGGSDTDALGRTEADRLEEERDEMQEQLARAENAIGFLAKFSASPTAVFGLASETLELEQSVEETVHDTVWEIRYHAIPVIDGEHVLVLESPLANAVRTYFSGPERFRAFTERYGDLVVEQLGMLGARAQVMRWLTESRAVWEKPLDLTLARRAAEWAARDCYMQPEDRGINQGECDEAFAADFEAHYGTAPTHNSAYLAGFLGRRHGDGGMPLVEAWKAFVQELLKQFA